MLWDVLNEPGYPQEIRSHYRHPLGWWRYQPGDLTAKWREAHMKELFVEMEQQAKYLNAGVNDDQKAAELQGSLF